jgi:CIC family chloride channel protein
MSFWGHGTHLLHGADSLLFVSPLELVPYLLLGTLCGLMALLFRVCLRSVDHVAFQRWNLPRWLSAGIGGLATGGVACLLPPVMDGQYTFIQNAMDGTFLGGFGEHSWWWWTMLFAAVAVAKCVATGFTVASGAPGGVLGPSVFIGGALGACVGSAIIAVAPEAFTDNPDNLRRALIPVGMAGLLSSSMRVPLAALVMVTEMTGSYGLIVPLMLVCFTSYMIGRRWGLSDDQVPSSAHSPAHAGDAVVHLLESETVATVMETHWPMTVHQNTTLHELIEKTELGTCPEFIVVENGRLEGVISILEIRELLESEAISQIIIASDIMTANPWTVHEEDSLYHALTIMTREKRVAVPVVKRGRDRVFVGMVTASNVHLAIKERLDRMGTHLLREHKELAAIESEQTVHHIATGASLGGIDAIQRLIVPVQVVGRSLREADFRRTFGIQVIAIEFPDGSIQCPPDVDSPLRTSQRLIAIVPQRLAVTEERGQLAETHTE